MKLLIPKLIFNILSSASKFNFDLAWVTVLKKFFWDIFGIEIDLFKGGFLYKRLNHVEHYRY